MRFLWLSLLLLLFGSFFSGCLFDTSTKREEDGNGPLRTVDRVELDRYVGVWYELARIPNRFQKKCVGAASATYSLRSDDKLEVVNECVKGDGKVIQARGVARVEDQLSNAKLKVSFVSLFGKNLFWGDYWVIALDPNYQYAIVGHPQRRYGWVLVRDPGNLPQSLDFFRDLLKKNGYRHEQFIFLNARTNVNTNGKL